MPFLFPFILDVMQIIDRTLVILELVGCVCVCVHESRNCYFVKQTLGSLPPHNGGKWYIMHSVISEHYKFQY